MSRGGWRRIAAFALIVAAFAVTARLVREAPLRPPPLPEALVADASAAPLDFTLPDLEGRPRASDEWRGRVLLLNFWAMWCAPCREELPALNALHRALAPEGFAVVAISLDRQPPESVARFLGPRGIEFPVLHDREHAFAERVGVRAYPTSVLLDRNGRVLVAIESAWDWAAPETRERLRAALAQ